jgi:hypothetical protein
VLKEEHVTGGVLDQGWENGFGVSNNLTPLTLTPSDPAYTNPSGDHTVGVATNSQAPDSGGVVLTCIDPGGATDYTWEAWVFTGARDSRRGIVVRADPTVKPFAGLPSRFISSYQFVIQSGGFNIAFRKVVDGAPTTLSNNWNAGLLPAGSLPANSWHKMKIVATSDTFSCFIDDFDLTAATGGPIVDPTATLTGGWVGVYNFSAFTGGIPVYFDDMVLSGPPYPVAAHPATWGAVKQRWK